MESDIVSSFSESIMSSQNARIVNWIHIGRTCVSLWIDLEYSVDSSYLICSDSESIY